MHIKMKSNKIHTTINFVLGTVLVCSITAKWLPNYASAVTSGECKGYAIYRDGVMLGVNDHAGLMDENNLRCYLPIIHAPGPNQTVEWGTFDEFLSGNSFLGVYSPKNCAMNEATRDSFVAKARELRGISYTFLKQIYYNAGENTWVLPENITDLRCDGVVEYVYEWYGYRVGGGDTTWDITRNSSENLKAHSNWKITPRIQNQSLLDRVGGQSLIN